MTFEGGSPVGRLVELFAPTLARIPTMDPVAREGLHITIQGIGFTDEVSAGDIEQIVDAARHRLGLRRSFDIAIGPPVVDEETIGMPVSDPDGLRQVRADLQSAIGGVWGTDRVPERGSTFTPHLSLSYSTGIASMSALRQLLQQNSLDGVRTLEHISAVSLIELNRDNHRYEWREIAKVELGMER
ncbi:2'-5' RNA ligase family protein [Nocardia terpenica]|uniref:2'-5' RNA ligase family protein n=1 Tax=Nocardia terpenica TaxID=455432 RepID=UPI001894CF56|nr:2'-5' RNA ligase family protein [Nocardia terpenica]MBF6059555.1 2'-5' RNA ligase family protein [Nocardia terpenica]MBF6102906.1 2'-5' RNA ligase family protein [Nocardia terpenica]MBF6110905.1 2'-5' RNA ligase family protein [Nocardia terpenica]MBF6117036.1 2'-5' RNA ligase family protein [Nocardia terpenica]MBF6151126.1 2'-5' RNA ligase family protein [Nocardia terpenica]